MSFSIVLEKSCNARKSKFQVAFPRKENHSEVIRVEPVETSTLDDQDSFLLQEIAGELLIVSDRVNVRIESRKHIERGLGFHNTHAGDR